jgi:hypothetical protein
MGLPPTETICFGRNLVLLGDAFLTPPVGSTAFMLILFHKSWTNEPSVAGSLFKLYG